MGMFGLRGMEGREGIKVSPNPIPALLQNGGFGGERKFVAILDLYTPLFN